MHKKKKNKAENDGFSKNEAFENQEIIGIDTAACHYGEGSVLLPDVTVDYETGEENPASEATETAGVVDPDEAADESAADTVEPLTEDELMPDNAGAAAIIVEESGQRNAGAITIAGNTAVLLYDFCYRLGIQSYRYGKRIFVRIGRLLMKPLRYGYSLGRFFVLGVDRLFFSSLHAIHEEAGFFRKEIKSSKKYLRLAMKDAPLSVFSILWHYIKKAFARHKEMFRTTANLMMPAIALAVLWLTVNYWNSLTFSLKLTNAHTTIGWVQDEAIYVKARSLANEQLGDTAVSENTQEPAAANSTATAAEDTALIKAELDNPEYNLALVKLNELSDESALFDNLIEESVQKLTNACGIFVDGVFIGAVKNETDATGVFDSILEPYKTNDAGTIAAFVEDVSYTQGLYAENTKMMEADELKNILTGKRSMAVFHKIQGGETFWDIAQSYGMSVDTLLSMNPGGPDQMIKIGDQIRISNEVNFLRVKLIKTETRIEDVAFETIKTDNPNLFRGDTRIIRKGVPGQVSVKELATYIDGVRVDAEIIEKTVLTEPIPQKTDVGTKSTTVYGAGGSYNVSVSNKGFVWPVPACHSVSSPFGYRSGGFHSGIDIAGSNTRGLIIVAAKDGVVESVSSGSSWGNYIVINHGGGIKTGYAHCLSGSVSVSPGQRVTAGQAIARVGSTGNSTGPHLHFEVFNNGSRVNPYPYVS